MKKLSLLLCASFATALVAFAGCSSTPGTASDAGADTTTTTDGSVTSVCDSLKPCAGDKPADVAEAKAQCQKLEASGKCLTELRAYYKCLQTNQFCNDAGESDVKNGACAAELLTLGGCGEAADGGTSDGGGTTDGGKPPAIVNGCTTFVDLTRGTADITWDLSLVGTPGRCLMVKQGQTVTWNGDFTSHPLKASGGTTPSPIVNGQPGDTDVAIQFDDPGVYGYVCEIHASMTGAIQVVP